MISTPIVRRFLISYGLMLSLMVAVSGYAVFQLGKLSAVAHIALRIEQRMIEQSDVLADAYLSEVRYAGKFTATQATVHYEQYKQFKDDFERCLAELKTLALSADQVQHLSQAGKYHAQYDELFEKEVEYIRTKQPYAETRYVEEKNRLVDYLLREHEAFKSDLQNSLQRRISYIEEAARDNQKLTLWATLVLAILGVILAYWLAQTSGGALLSSTRFHIVTAILNLRSSSRWKALGMSK
jgi:hypothetical protein